MFKLIRKKENTTRLHPAAEKLAETMADRILSMKSSCAARLDRLVNPRPLYQKKAILIVAGMIAACWCLYLIIRGVIR
ncbi:hypothetical protein SAMN05216464_113107 [Mucilaginibacter pineti]|uniref:Uncharacterized protein n=1 Tax=Mucilaginibacter pineti TaxID=1391627 RepID=A0A1G7INZ8_9SPHI|nr:hypothetical protein [Mucilaginibacter pineti]SDF14482.1 hypothetical protein SAMN05216464_113107 [Mucilaginibacter pineti]